MDEALRTARDADCATWKRTPSDRARGPEVRYLGWELVDQIDDDGAFPLALLAAARQVLAQRIELVGRVGEVRAALGVLARRGFDALRVDDGEAILELARDPTRARRWADRDVARPRRELVVRLLDFVHARGARRVLVLQARGRRAAVQIESGCAPMITMNATVKQKSRRGVTVSSRQKGGGRGGAR